MTFNANQFMIGDFTAYYLDEQELKTAIELNKKFDPVYTLYLVIKIVQHYGKSTFEGVICNGITFERETRTTKQNANTSSIYQAYNEKKHGAFTFDSLSQLSTH